MGPQRARGEESELLREEDQACKAEVDNDLDEEGVTDFRQKSSRWRSLARYVNPVPLFWLLLPSPLANALGHPTMESPKITPTTYLNGLRGIAAVIVIWSHMVQLYYQYHNSGWGAFDSPNNREIIQLPFVRLLTSGLFMVHIFFVLSGFALSYGFLVKSHAEQYDKALSGLPSSLFRRPIRLFLPLLPIILITPLLVTRGWQQPEQFSRFINTGYFAQLLVNLQLLGHVWRPFGFDDNPAMWQVPLWPHAWTLPVEFRGSLVVFVCCACFIRLRPWLRLVLTALLAITTLHQRPVSGEGFWDVFLFLVGVMFADMHILLRERRRRAENAAGGAVRLGSPDAEEARQDGDSPHELSGPPSRARGPLRAAAGYAAPTIATMVLLLGLFVGGYPMFGGESSMGYWALVRYWDFLRPSVVSLNHFWLSVGAVATVGSLEFLPRVRKVLDSPFFAWLGAISFGVYLCHWCIMQTIGKAIVAFLQTTLQFGPFWGAMVGIFLTTLLCIWVGDVHTRLCDTNSIRFARWLSQKFGV